MFTDARSGRDTRAIFARAFDPVFCGGGALVDAEAGLRCGVVDLSGTRVFADFVSGV